MVNYRDLVSNPANVIEEIYADLGLEMTSEYRELLLKEASGSRGHTSKHRYSLEEFGLDANEIQDRLAALFRRFEWERMETE